MKKYSRSCSLLGANGMHNRILQQKISDNPGALASVGFGVPRYLQLGLLTFVALMCAWSPSAEAQETLSAAVDFQRDVRPILVDNCFQCHGPDPGTREADLRLDTEEGAFATRPQGSVIVPGDFPASLLYQRIAHENQRRRMPPVVSNKTLTDAQIDVMRRWIEEGASWDQHWSLLFVFLIVSYLVATKTILGKVVFYFLKSVMWFPIIAGMLFYHVCVAIPLFKFRSRSVK